MEFWVFVAVALAVYALRRATVAERRVSALHAEVAQLRMAEEVRAAAAMAASEAAPAADADRVEIPDVQPPLPLPESAPGVDATVPGAGGAAEAPPLPPVLPPQLPTGGAVPPAAAIPESLESRIGSRWLLYVGVSAIVLGASYFVKYAFDNEWIPPAARVLLGLLAGLILIGAGQLFVGRGLERYGQALAGGGIGVLYLSIYAGYHWYALVGRPTAFAGMVGVTLGGAVIADRQRSQLLALFAVTVGFLTPALIGGGASSPVTLFTYVLVLAGGTLFLARRREWPALNLVSYVLTVLVLSAWGEGAYRPADYLIVQTYITVLLILFLQVYRENRRATGGVASLAAVLLAFAPVVYHFASLTILRPHRGAYFIYLIAFSLAGVIVAVQMRLAWLRFLFWLGAAIPFLTVATTRLTRGWLLAAWVTLVAIYAVHTLAQAQAFDDERERLPGADLLLLHGNGLWLLAAVWAILAPRDLDGAGLLAFGVAAVYVVFALAARSWHLEVALHLAGLAGGLAAVACAMYFSGPWRLVSFASEGAALVWLGLRTRRDWLRAGGLVLVVAALVHAAFELAAPGRLAAWPVANVRTMTSLFAAAAACGAAWLHHRSPGPFPSTIAGLVVGANVLVVMIASAEIDAYFDARAWSDGRPGIGGETTAALARQLSLSIAWAAYGVMLVAAGLRWGYAPVRYLAIGLFAITIGKVFLVDLARLDRVYRMLSVVGLGLLLLMASFLYQRLRAQQETGAPLPEPPPPSP